MIAARREFDIAATVSSADAALAFLSADWVDIILLDIQMPEVDGFETHSLPTASRGSAISPPFRVKMRNQINTGGGSH